MAIDYVYFYSIEFVKRIIRYHPVAIDGGCGIVRDDHPRNTANVLQHVDVGLDPACLLHVREGFGIGVGAVTHGSNEHIHFGDLACIKINDSGSITGPVDFDLLPGFPGMCIVAWRFCSSCWM